MATIEEVYFTDIVHKKDLGRAADGDLDKITGVENAKLALMHRLVTQPGSLVHRPDYGVGVKDWQNAVLSIDNKRSLARRINEQFLRDPRVEEVTGVRITQDSSEPGRVTLFVKVKLRGFGEEQIEFKTFGETVG